MKKKRYIDAVVLSFLLIFYSVSTFGAESYLTSDAYRKFKGRLVENVYTIQHAATLYPLSEPIPINDYNEQNSIFQKKSMFKDSFRFISNDQRGLLIEGVENNRYFGFDGKKLFFKAKKNVSHSDLELLLWDVIPYEGDAAYSPGLVKIQHSALKKNLELKNIEVHTTIYSLMLCKEEEYRGKEEFFSSPKSFEWHLHPFYPAAGYSNFFNIICDFGELIALKYETQLEAVKTKSSSPHDFCNLSAICLGKTNIFLNPSCPGYRSSSREIFSTEDYFTSNNPHAVNGSTLKLTRVIETEEIFQTTIENSLTTANKKSETQEDKTSERSDHTRSTGLEKIDQTSFDEKFSTQLNVSISQSEERSLEKNKMSTSSQDQGSSRTASKGSQSTHNLTANAGFNIPGFSLGGGYGYTNTVNSGESDTLNTNTHSARQSGRIARTASGDTKQKDSSKGAEIGIQNLSSKTGTQAEQKTQESGKESTSMETVEMEHVLNLTEVTSVTKKRNEKWFIEREFSHKPNTALHIKFFEQDIEAINVPFSSFVRVSGCIGFKFKDTLRSIEPRFSKDYLDLNQDVWCIAPATIIHYLPAPGYKINPDGSVDYEIKGTMNLKHPLNIITMINEINRSQEDISDNNNMSQ